MRLQKIREGKVTITVPAGRPWDSVVFFNPEAELTRDISVAALQTFQKMRNTKLTVCDALAGSGARGLRYVKEVKGLKAVVLNDNNPVAVRLIKRNIRANRVAKLCTASRCDANVLLSGSWFGVVDLDPFGPPVPFLDSAARSALDMLAMTATDTSALAGSYPEACLRKYGVRSMKTDYYAELGVRILITAIVCACARHEKAFQPLLSFASSHYYRIFGSIKQGRTAADKALGQFGWVSHCFGCGNHVIGRKKKCEICGSGMKMAGPVWLGQLNEKGFCQAVANDIRKRKFKLEQCEMRMLQLIEQESVLPPFYYDLHVIAKLNRKPIPRIEDVMKKLRAKGFVASRTHFCPTAVKTDSDIRSLLGCLRAGPRPR